MVKTLSKCSPPEPESRLPWDLVCSIGDVGPTKFVQINDPSLTLTYLTLRSNLLANAFKWEIF